MLPKAGHSEPAGTESTTVSLLILKQRPIKVTFTNHTSFNDANPQLPSFRWTQGPGPNPRQQAWMWVGCCLTVVTRHLLESDDQQASLPAGQSSGS